MATGWPRGGYLSTGGAIPRVRAKLRMLVQGEHACVHTQRPPVFRAERIASTIATIATATAMATYPS